MKKYENLSKDQLISQLILAEKQLNELTFSPGFKRNIKVGKALPNIPMAFVDADRKITYVNRAFCKLNGYIEEDFVGCKITDFSDDKDYESWDREQFARMLGSDIEIFRGEHHFRVKNGNNIWLDVITIAIRDDNGRFLRASYIFNDVSVSKHHEQELTDLLDTQRRVANVLMLMMQKETGDYENDVLRILLDRYGADRAYIFKFDWKKDTCSNIFEIAGEGITPEIDCLQHLPNELIKEALVLFREGKPLVLNNVVNFETEDDHTRSILEDQQIQSAIMFPIFVATSLWGYLGLDMVKKEKVWNDSEIDWLRSFTDIMSVGLSQKITQDELVRQKKTFDVILNSGSLGYWSFDTKTGVFDCSESYLTMLGYGPSELSRSANTLYQLVYPDDLPELRRFVAGLENEHTERSLEFRLKDRAGNWRWILSKIVLIERNLYPESVLVSGIHVDIDETKRAALKIQEKEIQLRQNEHKYAELFQSMSLGYAHNRICYDANGRPIDFIYEDMNSVFEGLLKHKKEECVGRRAGEMGHRMTAEVLDMFARVAASGKSHHCEYYSIHFDGWYNISVYSPRPGEFITLFNNVSSRYKAHEIVRQSEQKLRMIFENTPVGIIVFDERGNYQDSNEGVLHILNCRRQEISQFNIFDIKISSHLLKDKEVSFDLIYDVHHRQKAVNGNTPAEHIRYLQNKLVALEGDDDKYTGYLLIVADNTEQKKMEISLREAKEKQEITNSILSSVLGISHVLPWDCDVAAKMFSCDYETYHHESVKEPINGLYYCEVGKYIESIHPDYREHMRTVFEELLDGTRKDFHETYLVHWYNDREYEWIEKQGTVYEYDENGNPSVIIGSSIVITERKKMEQNLLLAIQQAEQSNRLKSAFLANMSHEIRTPLNSIVGFSRIMAMTDDVREKQEYASIIENNNDLLLQLISDILDISKIEAGSLEFVYSDVDINVILEEVEHAFRMKSGSEKVSVSFAERLPECRINTEKNRLLQVINNLMTNALKFTSEGEIRFGYRLKNPRTLYFYVTDTGCGIEKEQQDQIFGRFVKLNAFVQGTGLGLSICETIIKQLGGTIGVESKVGEGATFWFTIPNTPIGKTAGGEKKERRLYKNYQARPTILIAEDNASNYKLFESILKKNYALIHAWNGAEALKLFQEHDPDLILMDIKMPEMDGIEATVNIRKSSPDIPIIALTAFAYDSDKEQALTAGCNDYISKPVDSRALIRMIEEFTIY